MIILENEILRATIAPKGAELQSLINTTTGIEHMWSGDAAYWAKFSPVLFPIVGGLKNDTYYFNDTAYQLPRHGFARDKTFAAEQLSLAEAVFTLTHDEQTLAVYPFEFVLKLRYRLNGSTLSCTYEVYNPGKEELLFSVGAHPAFAVPFVKDTNYSDYYLQFNVAEKLDRWKLENGLIAAPEPLQFDNNTLPLQPSLFYEDAIVLKHMQTNTITLACTKNDHGIHFKFDDFPFFGIWAAKDAPFVCLEPWCGIADSVTHDQQLKNKEGINVLAANTNWQRSWSVACF
ncbi:aldose 1-epimerase family protein [Ferruginibacter sp. SUN106]|uniref:aldose 1-epimerase family protein n=1 Tax=Ferruginibacter sp. SUN106 TaxID=2978348 RepID=UPI003D36FBFA